MVIALFCAVPAMALPTFTMITSPSSCCCDPAGESSDSCPCESKKDCCSSCTVVLRAPVLAVVEQPLIFLAPIVRPERVDEDRSAGVRHEAPSLPPPEML
jgi:hypothetical protein